jgi:hypothetical protein
MKFKKIMLVTFLLLAILTIGAVSASDDATADGNLTADDIAEDPIEETPVDEVIAETPQPEVGIDAGDFNVWVNSSTFELEKDDDEIAVSFTSPEGADGDINFFIDRVWVCDRKLSNETTGQTFDLTFGELCVFEPGNHMVSFEYDGTIVDAGTSHAYKAYSREEFDTGVFDRAKPSERLYYLYTVPTQGTFIVYVDGQERFSGYIGDKSPYKPIYVDDVNITYNDDFNITTEYVIESTGQVVALDSFMIHVYNLPISVILTDDPLTISKGYYSVGYVGDDNYIDGTVLVYVDGKEIYTKAFSADDRVDYASFDMDELKLTDNITHGNHTVKIVYKKNGDADYSKEGLVDFRATAKVSAPAEISQGDDKYITVTYVEGTTGKITVTLCEKEKWGDGPYDYDFYGGTLFTTANVVNGTAKIPLKAVPAGYQGLSLDMVMDDGYTDDKLVRIDVKAGSPFKTTITSSKVTTTYEPAKTLLLH